MAVLEFKGKSRPSQADIDQVAAYARDLRCYHRDCADKPVFPVLVPTQSRGYAGSDCGVHIAGLDALDELLLGLEQGLQGGPVAAWDFLLHDAYRPLPTLVQAARELFHHGDLRTIHRARAATDPAVERITAIVHQAASTNSRRLVLLTGIPGAGKTLVGLRMVHAHFLDDLAVDRGDGKPTAPSVFLSGNGPLVEVLQYELRGAGGGGRAFVRDVRDYVRRYSNARGAVPPEHVLVFDEAQRAWSAEKVADHHDRNRAGARPISEPELFVEFAGRIPRWCVVLCLIGSGQEIHVGEEEGLVQWRRAVEGSLQSGEWHIHGPPAVREIFTGSSLPYITEAALNLDREIRFHLATDLHRFVEALLELEAPDENRRIAASLETHGYHLRVSRDLGNARRYLRERYREYPQARFGLVASSKDRDLVRFGIANDYQSTKRVRFGPWYSDPEGAEGGYSCRHLTDCVTEFGAQGLELDAVLLGWGTDLQIRQGRWCNHRARGYRTRVPIRDPFQLRINAYRVLLTRGRDATVVFVPPLAELDGTYRYLAASGFRELEG